MLVQRCEQSFKQLIDSIENQIQLSESLVAALQSERGVTRTNPFELRANSRFRCCGECVATIAADSFHMPGQEPKAIAIVRDLSRKGIGIIAHQQWYPEQLINLQLENAQVLAKVARARRLGSFCYEIGLIILKHELNQAT